MTYWFREIKKKIEENYANCLQSVSPYFAFFPLLLFVNGVWIFFLYYKSNYHKSKTEKQLSQRAQLCCILLGLCASTAVTKVFEPICFFFTPFRFSFSVAPMVFACTAIMTYGSAIGWCRSYASVRMAMRIVWLSRLDVRVIRTK